MPFSELKNKAAYAKAAVNTFADKNRLHNKTVYYFAYYESDFGPFSDDVDAIADAMYKLQGVDVVELRKIHGSNIVNFFVAYESEKVLISILISDNS